MGNEVSEPTTPQSRQEAQEFWERLAKMQQCHRDSGKMLQCKNRLEFLFTDNHDVLAASHKYFKDTNFHKFYLVTPRNPAMAEVQQHLSQVSTCRLDQYEGKGYEKAIAAWSSNDFYKQLNYALIHDSPDLRHWVWVCRAMNSYIVPNGVQSTVQLYRGSKVKPQQLTSQVGEIVRMPFYVACTPDMNLAQNFKETYMVRLNIDAGSYNASDITRFNVFGEKEILIPPYTPMRLVSKTAHELEYDVLDGLVESGNEEKKGKQIGVDGWSYKMAPLCAHHSKSIDWKWDSQ